MKTRPKNSFDELSHPHAHLPVLRPTPSAEVSAICAQEDSMHHNFMPDENTDALEGTMMWL